MDSVNTITRTFPKGKHSPIPAIFADTFDSRAWSLPRLPNKKGRGQSWKAAVCPLGLLEIKPRRKRSGGIGGNSCPPAPLPPRKDVIRLFSKVRSVYRNKHLSENRHEMLERHKCTGVVVVPPARLGTRISPSSILSAPPKSLFIHLIY